MKTQKPDIYQEVTDLIIDALEKGVKPRERQWQKGRGVGLPLRAW